MYQHNERGVKRHLHNREGVQKILTLFILMDYLIHIDTVSMELPIFVF